MQKEDLAAAVLLPHERVAHPAPVTRIDDARLDPLEQLVDRAGLVSEASGHENVLLLVEQLIQADYSREAEAAADAYGIEMLLNADVDPSSLGALFQKLLDDFGEAEGIAAHFTSHPALGDRIANANAAGASLLAPTPSLPDGAWQALRTICD